MNLCVYIKLKNYNMYFILYCVSKNSVRQKIIKTVVNSLSLRKSSSNN